MFTALEIENFKCLGHFNRSLGALTLLTGLNASGKSSVAQALAILRQTAVDNEWGMALELNGSSVQLGTMYDVIDRNSGGSGFRLHLATERWAGEWSTTSTDRKREFVARLSRIAIRTDEGELEWAPDAASTLPVRGLVPEFATASGEILDEIRGKLASISFIGAERVGPREVYVAQNPMPVADVGPHGEKTPWCLEQFGDSEINPSLVLPGIANVLRLTVQGWMGQLFPGFQLEIKRIDATNLVTAGIRTTPRGDFFRPVNVGFGITHVLPIITGCVAARPGRVMLIENPEAHLHPAGQSLVGYFLAVAAASGVQVIVETHSDHVLSGVRRALRDNRISSESVQIYFFGTETGLNGEALSKVEAVTVDRAGRIGRWPAGFFDQMESDLDYIHRE